MQKTLFFIILLLPWALDLLSPSEVMNSLLGSLSWGLCCVFAFSSLITTDNNLLSLSRTALSFLSGVWICFWILSLTNPDQNLFVTGYSSGSKSLIILHVGFLILGACMVMSSTASSLFWLFKDSRIRKKNNVNFLPSLESLKNTSIVTWKASSYLWGIGLFIACIQAFEAFQQVLGSERSKNWLIDHKLILSTLLFALILCIVVFIQKTQHSRKKFKIIAFAGLFFTLCFLLMNSGIFIESQHENIRWFLR